MNLNVTNVTDAQADAIGRFAIETQNLHIYTTQEVINNFGQQFIFKIELMVFSFFILMMFLQYYTTKIEKNERKQDKWNEHLHHLGVEPIIKTAYERSKNDKILCIMSDIFFMPSIAFVLIIISYNTGWF